MRLLHGTTFFLEVGTFSDQIMDILIALWFINEKMSCKERSLRSFQMTHCYNHQNKLATHHVDRHRNRLGAYNFDVQFVKGTLATKMDKGRPRVNQDLEKETVQS